MRHRWIAFSAFGVLALIVLVFFAIRLQPMKPPVTNRSDAPTAGSLATPSITYVDPSRGAAAPDVTIVTFSDYACAHCRDLEISVARILASDKGLRHVWKDMPNEAANPLSGKAAQAAHCAAREGKYWAVHDLLFASQDFLSQEAFAAIAQQVDLNAERFASCFENGETRPLVLRGRDEGLALGIDATPTFFVNNVKYVGVATEAELASYVAAARR